MEAPVTCVSDRPAQTANLGKEARSHVSADAIITIGSNATCDLVLGDDPTVAGLHAQARLDTGRFLWIRDENSRHGTHLHRNDNWVQVRLVAVCEDDVLRFGNTEVSTQQLVDLFGPVADPRLAPAPRGNILDRRTGRYTLENKDDEPTLSNLKRNPGTGEIEDKSE